LTGAGWIVPATAGVPFFIAVLMGVLPGVKERPGGALSPGRATQKGSGISAPHAGHVLSQTWTGLAHAGHFSHVSGGQTFSPPAGSGFRRP
jgi:hypothetical protein